MHKRRMAALLTGLVLILATVTLTSSNNLAQQAVEVLGGFIATDNFDQSIAPLLEETDIGIVSSDVEGLNSVLLQRVDAGDPPNLYVTPQPGVFNDLQARGAGVDLVGSGVFTQEELDDSYTPAELALGQSSDGTQHGIFIRANFKSAIWYNPKMFDQFGYEIPETWDELIALSDQIVADGLTPWCHAFESGAASGWPGTDWIEDIVLHKDGPEVYDAWVAGEVGFSDPRIQEAFQMFLDVVLTEGYTFGGPVNALATPFGEGGNGLFSDEGDEAPNCFMFKQAQFIAAFFEDNNPGVSFGEDYDFFPFPTITPEYADTVLGAGVLMGMAEDSPEAREVIRFVNTPEFQVTFAQFNDNVPPNNNVAVDETNVPDPLARQAAAELGAEGAVFRFDGSDLMPSAVGGGSFWTAILDLVSGAPLEPTLQSLDEDFEAATN